MTLFEVFFKAHILNYQRMKACGLVDTRNNFLAEDGANIVSGIGLAVFLVDNVGDVLVLLLVNFQVKNFLVRFS
jgi:hypothetical protein